MDRLEALPGAHFARNAKLLLAAITAAGFGGELHAQEWRITPRIEVEQAWNDNIFLARKGQTESDFITAISPGIVVRGNTRRLRLNVDYDPQQLFFWHNSDQNEFRQRLRGFGQAELLERLLFLDASGTIDQQFARTRDVIGTTTLTASPDLVDIRAFQAGPTLVNRFGSFARSQFRYRYGLLETDAEDIADETLGLWSLVVDSGEDFTVLSWRTTAASVNVDRAEDSLSPFAGTSFDQDFVKFDGRYTIRPIFAFLAGVGYEEIRDPTLIDEPTGVIWDVGGELRLSRNSFARLTYGERFGDTNWNAEARYRAGAFTTLRLQYTQTIETSASILLRELNLIGLAPSGALVETETGRPIPLLDPFFDLADAAFRRDRFLAGITISGRRDRYALDVFDEQRDFDVSESDSERLGVILSWTRQLTPRLDLNIGASYAHVKFESAPPRSDDYYSGLAGLGLRLSPTAELLVSYRRGQRNSDVADDVAENVVIAGLRKIF